jgi:diguanylate cyclase
MAQDEQQRLDALHQLEILDTPQDARFDRIVRVAQLVGGTPIVAISLIDRDRLWMKSHVGLATDELLREGSFCDVAVHSDGLYLAEDTLLDPALCELPMVVGEPRVRFYAAFPLRAPNGSRVGNLALLDVQPRVLSAAQIAALVDLAFVTEDLMARDAVDAELVGVHERDRLRGVALSSLNQGVLLVRMSTVEILLANDAVRAILGYSVDELRALWFRGDFQSLDEDGRVLEVEERPLIQVLMTGQPQLDRHIQWPHKDGYRVVVRMSVIPLPDDPGVAVVTFVDVTEQRRVERELRLYEKLYQHANDIISVVDADYTVRYTSPSARTLLGFAEEVTAEAGIFAPVHRDDRERFRDFLRRVADGGSAGVGDEKIEGRVRTADGTWLHLQSVAVNLLDDRAVQGIVVTSRDISDRVLLDQQLEYSATHDRLTGLVNRALIDEQLTPAMARSVRSGRRLALCYVDLDDFKAINDELGHLAGDEVLVEVGARLRGALRAGDVAGRIGGDEFVVILDPVRDEAEATAVAERILANIAGVAHLTEGSVQIGASVGVSLNLVGDTADRLLRRADLALLDAKRSGKNQVRMISGAPPAGPKPTV